MTVNTFVYCRLLTSSFFKKKQYHKFSKKIGKIFIWFLLHFRPVFDSHIFLPVAFRMDIIKHRIIMIGHRLQCGTIGPKSMGLWPAIGSNGAVRLISLVVLSHEIHSKTHQFLPPEKYCGFPQPLQRHLHRRARIRHWSRHRDKETVNRNKARTKGLEAWKHCPQIKDLSCALEKLTIFSHNSSSQRTSGGGGCLCLTLTQAF